MLELWIRCSLNRSCYVIRSILLCSAMVCVGTIHNSRSVRENPIVYSAEWEFSTGFPPKNCQDVLRSMDRKLLLFYPAGKRNESEYNIDEIQGNPYLNHCDEVYFKNEDIDRFNYIFDKMKSSMLVSEYPSILSNREESNKRNVKLIGSYKTELEKDTTKELQINSGKCHSTVNNVGQITNNTSVSSNFESSECATELITARQSENLALTANDCQPNFSSPSSSESFSVASSNLVLYPSRINYKNTVVSSHSGNDNVEGENEKSGIDIEKSYTKNSTLEQRKDDQNSSLKSFSPYISKLVSTPWNNLSENQMRVKSIKKHPKLLLSSTEHKSPKRITGKNVNYCNPLLKFMNASIRYPISNEQQLAVPVVLKSRNTTNNSSGNETIKFSNKVHLLLPINEVGLMEKLLNNTFYAKVVEGNNTRIINNSTNNKYYVMYLEKSSSDGNVTRNITETYNTFSTSALPSSIDTRDYSRSSNMSCTQFSATLNNSSIVTSVNSTVSGYGTTWLSSSSIEITKNVSNVTCSCQNDSMLILSNINGPTTYPVSCDDYDDEDNDVRVITASSVAGFNITTVTTEINKTGSDSSKIGLDFLTENTDNKLSSCTQSTNVSKESGLSTVAVKATPKTIALESVPTQLTRNETNVTDINFSSKLLSTTSISALFNLSLSTINTTDSVNNFNGTSVANNLNGTSVANNFSSPSSNGNYLSSFVTKNISNTLIPFAPVNFGVNMYDSSNDNKTKYTTVGNTFGGSFFKFISKIKTLRNVTQLVNEMSTPSKFKYMSSTPEEFKEIKLEIYDKFRKRLVPVPILKGYRYHHRKNNSYMLKAEM